MRLFRRVLDLDAAERQAFLDREIGGDAALRSEVDALLDADARGGAFLERPIVEAAEFGAPDFGVGGDVDYAGHAGVGSRVGPFVIVGRLGEGEHAEVYEAVRDGSPGKHVALKVLRPGAGRREVVRRFEAERRIIAALDHPGIARLLDSGTTADGRAYFVMERIEGEAITAFCERARLGLPERVRLLAGVCEAVEHAHQRGVIHRDLKPSNILAFMGEGRATGGLSASGSVAGVRTGGRATGGLSASENTTGVRMGGQAARGTEACAKVIDFGIAKALAEGLREQSTLTTQGRILGTIPYMSPERFGARGHEADTRADVYALGAVLYEMLAGRPAFDLRELDPAAAARRIVEESPARLGALNARCRGDLETVVAKAMAKEPGRRYASVAAFREDLERWEAGRPVEARRPSAAYLARRWVGRHRTGAAVGAVCGMVAVGALAFAWSTHQQRVRGLADTAEAVGLMHDQAVQMAKRTGLRGERREWIAPYMAMLERRLAERSDDPEWMDRWADMAGEMGVAELDEGLVAAARERADRVLAVREELVRRFPRSHERLMDLSVAIVRAGDVDKEQGALGQAAAKYQRAFEMDQRLALQRPNDPRAIELLLWSHQRLAWMKLNGHDRSGPRTSGTAPDWWLEADRAAVPHYREMLRLAERLCKLTGRLDAHIALSKACAALADRADTREDPDLVAGLVARAVEHAQVAAAMDPRDREASRHLATTLAWVSKALRAAAAGDNPAGAQRRAEALAAARRLAAAEPGDVSARWTLVIALQMVAEGLEAAGDLHGALAAAEEEAREAAAVRALTPASPEANDLVESARANAARLRERLAQRLDTEP